METIDTGSKKLEDCTFKEVLDYFGVWESEEIIDMIKYICRLIQPKGYIDKEDAKKILCDYIDCWMIKRF